MKEITLNQLYDIMYYHLDTNGWWPNRSNWEVIWSTVLIQNTNWKNVDKALKILYKATNFLQVYETRIAENWEPKRILQFWTLTF